MLNAKGSIFGLAMLAIGIFVGYLFAAPEKPVEAINVVGAEVITTDALNATFTVFKTSEESIQTTTDIARKDLLGQDKGNPVLIADKASAGLQFLADFHQSLAVLQSQYPCPGPDCDPDIEINPARCDLFWEDLDPGVDHPIIPGEPADTLTSRNVIINVAWDGTIYVISLRDPSRNPDNFPDNC